MAEISNIEFFKRKRDFSHLLVHLTKDDESVGKTAKQILEKILNERILIAANYYCLFGSDLDIADASLREQFKVVCFTETPIDLIDVLLMDLEGRRLKPKPFGLVFTKDFIRKRLGNPVFYAGGHLFDSLWKLYYHAKSTSFDKKDYIFLALVNKCDEKIDFHWEREWRVVGNSEFNLTDIYCALCPESDIEYFEKMFTSLPFIDPCWGINQILGKLVQRARASNDIPF
jgi:hypothetical protein